MLIRRRRSNTEFTALERDRNRLAKLILSVSIIGLLTLIIFNYRQLGYQSRSTEIENAVRVLDDIERRALFARARDELLNHLIEISLLRTACVSTEVASPREDLLHLGTHQWHKVDAFDVDFVAPCKRSGGQIYPLEDGFGSRSLRSAVSAFGKYQQKGESDADIGTLFMKGVTNRTVRESIQSAWDTASVGRSIRNVAVWEGARRWIVESAINCPQPARPALVSLRGWGNTTIGSYQGGWSVGYGGNGQRSRSTLILTKCVREFDRGSWNTAQAMTVRIAPEFFARFLSADWNPPVTPAGASTWFQPKNRLTEEEIVVHLNFGKDIDDLDARLKELRKQIATEGEELEKMRRSETEQFFSISGMAIRFTPLIPVFPIALVSLQFLFLFFHRRAFSENMSTRRLWFPLLDSPSDPLLKGNSASSWIGRFFWGCFVLLPFAVAFFGMQWRFDVGMVEAGGSPPFSIGFLAQDLLLLLAYLLSLLWVAEVTKAEEPRVPALQGSLPIAAKTVRLLRYGLAVAAGVSLAYFVWVQLPDQLHRLKLNEKDALILLKSWHGNAVFFFSALVLVSYVRRVRSLLLWACIFALLFQGAAVINTVRTVLRWAVV